MTQAVPGKRIDDESAHAQFLAAEWMPVCKFSELKALHENRVNKHGHAIQAKDLPMPGQCLLCGRESDPLKGPTLGNLRRKPRKLIDGSFEPDQPLGCGRCARERGPKIRTQRLLNRCQEIAASEGIQILGTEQREVGPIVAHVPVKHLYLTVTCSSGVHDPYVVRATHFTGYTGKAGSRCDLCKAAELGKRRTDQVIERHKQKCQDLGYTHHDSWSETRVNGNKELFHRLSCNQGHPAFRVSADNFTHGRRCPFFPCKKTGFQLNKPGWFYFVSGNLTKQSRLAIKGGISNVPDKRLKTHAKSGMTSEIARYYFESGQDCWDAERDLWYPFLDSLDTEHRLEKSDLRDGHYESFWMTDDLNGAFNDIQNVIAKFAEERAVQVSPRDAA